MKKGAVLTVYCDAASEALQPGCMVRFPGRHAFSNPIFIFHTNTSVRALIELLLCTGNPVSQYYHSVTNNLLLTWLSVSQKSHGAITPLATIVLVSLASNDTLIPTSQCKL